MGGSTAKHSIGRTTACAQNHVDTIRRLSAEIFVDIRGTETVMVPETRPSVEHIR